MAALKWLTPLLLLLALASTDTEASCVAGDVCCEQCTAECPDNVDRIHCNRQCLSVDCSDIQEAQCGSGKVCCDNCEAECPGFPESCASNCVTLFPLPCNDPPAACSTPNAVACSNCAIECPGHPATCEKNCREDPPVVDGNKCVEAGIAQAGVVADTACFNTKVACGIIVTTTTSGRLDEPVPISLKDCCLVVMGSCADDVINKFPCDSPGNYGNCVDAHGFMEEYKKQAKDECISSICDIEDCAKELQNENVCP